MCALLGGVGWAGRKRSWKEPSKVELENNNVVKMVS